MSQVGQCDEWDSETLWVVNLINWIAWDRGAVGRLRQMLLATL